MLNIARSLIGAIGDDIREEPMDMAPWLSAVVYFSAMLFFGVLAWKAAVVAAILLIAMMYNYGRRTLVRGGILVLFFTLAVWIEIIPDPARWGAIVNSLRQ